MIKLVAFLVIISAGLPTNAYHEALLVTAPTPSETPSSADEPTSIEKIKEWSKKNPGATIGICTGSAALLASIIGGIVLLARKNTSPEKAFSYKPPRSKANPGLKAGALGNGNACHSSPVLKNMGFSGNNNKKKDKNILATLRKERMRLIKEKQVPCFSLKSWLDSTTKLESTGVYHGIFAENNNRLPCMDG